MWDEPLFLKWDPFIVSPHGKKRWNPGAQRAVRVTGARLCP